MECPFCERDIGGWRPLHRHLVDEHGDAVQLESPEGDAPPEFRVGCPACGWAFAQPMRGQRRDAAFIVEHRSEISLVAFDQLLLHWAEAHVADTEEEAATGGGDGDSERV